MSRALDFFLAPPTTAGDTPAGSPLAAAPPPAWPAPGTVVAPLAAPPGSAPPAWPAPSAPLGAPPVAAPPVPHTVGDPLAAPPAAALVPPVRAGAVSPARTKRKQRGRQSADPVPINAGLAAITGAAVVGRPGEAEPVAAALALALRRETRSKAATVAVIGPPLPEANGGGGAGRRLAARLEAHGLEARVRGRLAWVRLDPASPDLVNVAWQVALLAAPVVFAVMAPRTPSIDAALAEQDLVVLVTADPDGPLAHAAAGGLNRVVAVRPLGRGLGRELSRAGLRPAAPIRALLRAGGVG